MAKTNLKIKQFSWVYDYFEKSEVKRDIITEWQNPCFQKQKWKPNKSSFFTSAVTQDRG